KIRKKPRHRERERVVKICEASECEDEDDDGAGIGKPDLARVQNYRIDDLPEEINKSRKGWRGPYKASFLVTDDKQARRRSCEASATALTDLIDLLAENLMALLTGHRSMYLPHGKRINYVHISPNCSFLFINACTNGYSILSLKLEEAAWQKLSLCIGFVLQAIGNVLVYGCCSLTGRAIRMICGFMSSPSNASAELALKSVM
ncbi:unnamed protein product, partial [Prunus brigantina]